MEAEGAALAFASNQGPETVNRGVSCCDAGLSELWKGSLDWNDGRTCDLVGDGGSILARSP